MTCSNGKKYFFGVKSLILYDQDTFVPKGIFEVIGSVEYSEEIEKLLLTGGHRKGAWAIEAGEPALSLTATLKEYPNFAFEMFANADITETTGEDATGFVDTIANQVGTSITHATTGIASIQVDTAADLKYGRYYFKATGAMTGIGAITSDGVITTTSNIELGHASDNTLSAAAGVLSVEGNAVYMAGGTDVADGDVVDILTLDIENSTLTAITDTEILIGTGAGTSNYAALSGDVTMTNAGVTSIGNDKVLEADLKAVNAPTDEYCLTYESTDGDFEWHECGGSGLVYSTKASGGDTLVDGDCGGFHISTGAQTITLPDCDAGLLGCRIQVMNNDTGELTKVATPAGDTGYLIDGTSLGGAAQDFGLDDGIIHGSGTFVCAFADMWYVVSQVGVITDEN